MADDESHSPFYENRWFKGTAASVALLVSVAALVGPLRSVIDDLFSSDLPRVDTEIVFDTGSTMNSSFGGSEQSKLDWAKQRLARDVIPYRNEGLALRTFGGPCGQPGNLAVPFGADHGDDVTKAVNNVRQGEGDSDLSVAVQSAIDDFTGLPSDTVKQVIVYVGAVNQCGLTSRPAEESAKAIKQFMQNKGVKPHFKFIGVDLSSQEQAQLQSFKSVLPGLEVVGPSGTSGTQGKQ
jgi:hypothetical protein